MQVKVKISSHGAPLELSALAVFLSKLAVIRNAELEAPVKTLPVVDPIPDNVAEINKFQRPEPEPEPVFVPAPVAQVEEVKPAVTRRRRSRAEIEAEASEAAALAAAEAQAPAAEAVAAEDVAEPTTATVAEVVEPKTEQVDTATGEITEVAASGKTFTAAEVQALAAVVARTKGPALVKNKIATFGAERIAALTADQLNILGDFLEANKD